VNSGPNADPGGRFPLMVDAHVHLHRCFPLVPFLVAAEVNVRAGAHASGFDMERAIGVLLLTAGIDEDGYERLHALTRGEERGWRAEPTDEPESLVLTRDGRPVLVAVAGQQVVTREGIEVLGLAFPGRVPDGLDLLSTIDRLEARGALPVLPWGFGKWWFARGRRVRSCLERMDRRLMLGDNGGRPSAFRTRGILALGAARGIPVLPGSDPLPFPDHAGRAGSTGFVMAEGLDERRPSAQLRRWVLALEGSPPSFGRRVGLSRFAADQLRMQWRKRVARRSGPSVARDQEGDVPR
jgi:hypothetical protein